MSIEILPLKEGSQDEARSLLAKGYRLVGIDSGLMVFDKSVYIDQIDLETLTEAIKFLVTVRNSLVAADPTDDAGTMDGATAQVGSCSGCHHFEVTGKQNKEGVAGGYCSKRGWSTKESDSCPEFKEVV